MKKRSEQTEDSYLIQQTTTDVWLNVVANVDNDEWIEKKRKHTQRATV